MAETLPISGHRTPFSKAACRSLYWTLCCFAQLFSAPADRAPQTPSDTVDVISAMSCGHLMPEMLECVKGGEYAGFLTGPAEDFVYEWRREPKVAGFDAIIEKHDPDPDLRLFALSDLVEDMVVLWRQAAADEDSARTGQPVPKAGHFGIAWTHEPPFSSPEDAAVQNVVQSYISAYFDGVPIQDIALDEGPWVIHNGWWFSDRTPQHLVEVLECARKR